MNLEFKSNNDITEVKCDNGEIKNIKTSNNLYDILTIENIIEYITKLRDNEEKNKVKLNKELKRSNLLKILRSISTGILVILNCISFISLFIVSSSIVDILFFILLIICLAVGVVNTKNCYILNENLIKKVNKNSANLEYLEYKINYAKELLEEFKRNSDYVNIEDKKSHTLDVDIIDIYKDQYNMFDRLSERAVDTKKDEPLWQAYEADFNQDEINIVKNTRKRIINKK